MTKAPRYCRAAAWEYFAAQMSTLAETESLVRAAIAVSMHELDEVTPTAVETDLTALAVEVRGRVRSQHPQALLAHLHEVLFEQHGFAGDGDDYYNSSNSYLSRILATKRGIPVSLCLLYKSIAQRVGLVVRGVNAPMHFLAGVEIDCTWMLVDPFHGGRVLTEGEVFQRLEQLAGSPVARSPVLLATATHPQWIARLVRNLEQIFASENREEDQLAMQELLSLVPAMY